MYKHWAGIKIYLRCGWYACDTHTRTHTHAHRHTRTQTHTCARVCHRLWKNSPYWRVKWVIINHKPMIAEVTDTSPASPCGIIQLQVQDLNLPKTVSANALAPRIRPSAATAMTTKTWFCQSVMVIYESARQRNCLMECSMVAVWPEFAATSNR